MGDQEEDMSQVCAEDTFAEAEGITEGTELLQGQYLIQSLLSSGGFGITYIARDSLARQVVIKECFPAELCKRDGVTVHPVSPDLKLQFGAIKNQFVREARQMAQLVHPNIVPVHQVFEENNTAYMALDKINGIDLVTLAEETPERITNALLRSVLRQSLKAINFIHGKGLLHRDISPDNIMLDDNGHLTLIDFGAAREFNETNRSTVMAVKDGYSPYEFYDQDGDHGFYSDLYSLAATIYFLAVGSAPPSSDDRMHAVKDGQADPYTPLMSQGIRRFTAKDEQIFATVDRALSLDVTDRYASVADWAKDLVDRQRSATPNRSEEVEPARASAHADNPHIETEIADIVKHTNEELTVSKARSEKNVIPKEPVADLPTRKTMFDIFGNPVENVPDWLEQQEAEIEARKQARLAQIREEEDAAKRMQEEIRQHQDFDEDAIFEPALAEAPPREKRSRLAAFLGRVLSPNHSTLSR